MKRAKNKEDGSTSSASTPEAFVEPSASLDPPEPENPENIEDTSSPLPPEPFPEPSPSPDSQELEPQPSTSTGITQTPAKTYELERGEPQMAREFIVTMMDNNTYNQAK